GVAHQCHVRELGLYGAVQDNRGVAVVAGDRAVAELQAAFAHGDRGTHRGRTRQRRTIADEDTVADPEVDSRGADGTAVPARLVVDEFAARNDQAGRG